MIEPVVERYLLLGLRIGRHVAGIVDAYYGPPELAAAVDAEPPVEPGELVDAAETLLDELEDGWLRDQVVGLRTYAGVLAGETGSYADEVEGCYGVRPTYIDEAVFAAAHEQLEELLPGEGPLAELQPKQEITLRGGLGHAASLRRYRLPCPGAPRVTRRNTSQSCLCRLPSSRAGARAPGFHDSVPQPRTAPPGE